MGCVIKIGNQSVSETDFLNHLNKIININKLFEENLDFSSKIYEALGFSKKLDFYKGDTLAIDEKIYNIVEKISSKELAKRNGLTISSNIPVYIVSEFLGTRKGGYDTVNNVIILSKDSDKETIHHELIHSVEYNLDKSELNPLYEKVKDSITEDSFDGFVSWNFRKNISEFVADALSKKAFRNALKKEGLLEEVDNVLSVYTSGTTPQQKQQAQQLYSQYLDTKQPDVILPIGTSGSGKSTFIKSLPQENLVVIEPDSMRVEFTGNMNDKSKDKEIYIEAANRAVAAIKQGKQVVFDTTNLTKDKRLPFIEAIKKAIPIANIQYKLMELNPELAKQRIKAQLERGENRAAVSDETIDRHAASYKQMLEDIKNEPITEYKELGSKQDIEGFKEFVGKEKPAAEAGEELKNVPTSQIITSPLDRTVETSNIILEQQNKVGKQGTLFSLKPKSEIERMLTEGDAEVRELIKAPDKEVVVEKLKTPNVITKMKSIIDTLGIKMEISDLGDEIAAQADILNRLIKFADDSITEDNFTEETVHFIVEILEQKNPELYRLLESNIWKYQIYTDVKRDYSNFPEYRNPDGSLNVVKIKKEAIGQLLTAKLLNQEEIKDKKNFWGSVWETISNFIKDLFYKIPYSQRDEFQNLADRIMQDPMLIETNDVKYLTSESKFFARNTKNKLASSLAKARRTFGKEKEGKVGSFVDEIEAFEFFKNMDADTKLITEKELNPLTNEYEDVDYYVYKDNKKVRVSTIISEANKKTFANVSQDEVAKALREAKKQKGTEVHQTIQEILERYIDKTTGLLREEPLDTPLNINIPKEAYKRLENHLSNRLDTYPKGTRFLTETKVVNEEQGYAGTIDFMAILPTGEIDILDWKTTDVTYWEAGERHKRFDISPFNQTYWKIQITFYKRALESNGVKDFRYTRAIPIALETRQKLVDRNKPATPDNVIYDITNLQVGNSNPKKIKKNEFYLVPVSIEEEKTGVKELDELVEKLQGIYERLRTSQYSKEDAYKKRQDLDRLSSAIREIQTKRTATLFTGLFAENFDRFEKLAEQEFDFLKNVRGKRLLEKEQEDQLHTYFNDIYSAVEFLQTFERFPTIINTLYEDEEISDYDKQILKESSKIGNKASQIAEKLINNATDAMDKLGELYEIDNLSAEDNRNISGFISGFVSILHREEKSIQFAARLINVIKLLGQRESKEYFDADNGKFTIVFNKVKEWAKNNEKNWNEVYSYLLSKDENGNPLRQLADKISSEYRTELKNKKEELINIKKGIGQTLADLGYTGKVYERKLDEEYKSHVIEWLKKNYNLDKYDENYKKALEEYKESIKDLRLDEDNIENKKKKDKLLKSWIASHDIYSSPDAISLKDNYLLYSEGVLKEEKWYSDEYRTLKESGNKPLLEAYELFISLNKRAQDNGMLDDVFSARLWLPNVSDPSLKRAAFMALKDGYKGAWYAIMKIADFVKRHLNFIKDVDGIEQDYDPLTGKELRKIPVKYKYLDIPELERKDGETATEFEERKKKARKEAEGDLSNDLFEIYAKWADHIIKYEMLSNYENRFKMIQLLETLKDKAIGVDSRGNITYKRDKSGLKTNEYQLTTKDPRIESELATIINNYVYSSSLDVKPEYYKILNLLYDYSTVKFLGFNVTSWISSFVGASFSARVLEGKWFSKNDILNIGISTTLGTYNEELGKYGKDLFTKSRYLIHEFDTRILSEYDKDPSAAFNTKKFDFKNTAFSGFRLGDHFIQDTIASSIFLNTTIIDGKFVNINDYVKAKYNSKIYDTNISSSERSSLVKQRDEEIDSMKKEKNLYRFIKETDGKFSIEGIDLNTIEGKAEALKYQNIVAHYIKQAIGNIDEFDKSINRMTWGWKFIMQFKNWMPRAIGSRFQDIEYQYEFDDYHYGRAAIFIDAFKNNTLVTLKETLKSLTVLIPFVDRKTGSIDLIKAAKDAYIRKSIDAIKKGKKFDITEDQFIDTYVTGFKNQITAVANLAQLGMCIALVMSYSSGDRDKWYWKLLYKSFFKIRRELTFEYDPDQMISFLSQGIFPVLTSVSELVNTITEFGKEIKNPKKGHPIASTIKLIPGLRELHYWLSILSKKYAKTLDIKQPKPQSLI